MHIREIIEKFIKEKEKEVSKREELVEAVNGALGGKIKNKVKIEKVEKGKIFFKATSSAVAYEFNLRKKKVLEGVRCKFPEIKEIKIEVK
ncbi:MAG: DUF721 domain-containing protein [Candidatus Omnitrophica bacterium]|nr:DUF721 domain-containing protein [Candidatus Omnitrophota bacterium]